MTYWLNLFTGTTWDEFQRAGATVSGFREHTWNRAKEVKPGDIFLCYMVGVGMLEVTSERFRDEERIFSEEPFPVRFRVKQLVALPAEHGVPMESLKGQLTFLPADLSSSKWSGHVRSSLTKYKDGDASAIAGAVREAEKNPVKRAVDKRQLERSANLYKTKLRIGDQEVERVVSIPTAEDEQTASPEPVDAATHSEIQWRLLDLGSQMGLDVWAPNRDRGRCWKSKLLGDVARLRDRLPTQFDYETNRTIEEIDVLWLSGQMIVAAFEVEHTTSIFSGLLRMSDLLTMQPNLDMKLYIVGPDEKSTKFRKEVARPTFAARPKPLHSLCRFLPYSRLCSRLEEARSVIKHLRPDFLDDFAELYRPEVEMET
jgi:hypothetical protein